MVKVQLMNPASFQKSLKKVSRNMDDIMPYTLSNCAFAGRAKLQHDMPKYIHNPTPRTIKGVYYTRAKKKVKNPFSEVKFSNLAWKYMRYAVLGGTRTGSTLTAPVQANKNQYGNVTPANRAKNLLGRDDSFRATINGTDGVWQRKGSKLNLMHIYKSALNYRPRLPMQSIVIAEAKRVFPAKFAENARRALAKSAKL